MKALKKLYSIALIANSFRLLKYRGDKTSHLLKANRILKELEGENYLYYSKIIKALDKFITQKTFKYPKISEQILGNVGNLDI